MVSQGTLGTEALVLGLLNTLCLQKGREVGRFRKVALGTGSLDGDPVHGADTGRDNRGRGQEIETRDQVRSDVLVC